jgi:hypothetical protein
MDEEKLNVEHFIKLKRGVGGRGFETDQLPVLPAMSVKSKIIVGCTLYLSFSGIDWNFPSVA